MGATQPPVDAGTVVASERLAAAPPARPTCPPTSRSTKLDAKRGYNGSGRDSAVVTTDAAVSCTCSHNKVDKALLGPQQGPMSCQAAQGA